jgi:hypothetical protein
MQFVKLAEKGVVPKLARMVAAEIIENYANNNISEDLEAFGQFMYHAELLRLDHLDVYLVDLHMVEQPYRDMLVNVFGNLHSMHDEDTVDDGEDSDEDTPL